MAKKRGKRQPKKRRTTRTAPSVIGTASLAVVLDLFDDGSPPSEFRLFKRGLNETEIGEFLFDDQAASATMADYEAHGVDRMVDLEHLSLDPKAPNYDPDSRASCKLELRDGELWAVEVKWTPDGARRLSEKTQRYVSPFFLFDSDRRVVKVINIALVAMPATHQTPELVAASVAASGAQIHKAALAEGAAMNPELVKKALDALQAGDAEAAAEILKEMVAAAAADGEADPEPDPEGEAMLQDEPADGELPAEGEPPDEGDAPTEEEAAASAAVAVAQLLSLTGKKDLTAAVLSVSDVVRDAAKFQKDKAAFEFSRRKESVLKLQKLGAESPHTTGLSKGKLNEWFRNVPIDMLEARVAAKLKENGGKMPTPIKPPTGAGAHGLEEHELAACTATGCKPEEFARIKAQLTPSR